MRLRGEAPGDPGLAAERTAMTWQRMALAFTSLGAVVLGVGAHRNTPWLVLPAAALFLVAAVIWRYWRRRAVRPRDDLGRSAPLLWLTAAAVATAVTAAALTVVHPG
jgi:uncharacterized membrane protein YidH (DUF202 family)